MTQFNMPRLIVASLVFEIFEELESIVEKQAALLKERAWRFISGEVTPDAAYQLEVDLEELSREMNRILTEFAYNHVEGAGPDSLPKHIWFEGGFYRRLNRKTRNQHVATRFGKITLWRFPYRDDHTGDSCVFPLEAQLGYAALINGPGCAFFRVAGWRAVDGDGIARRMSGTKMGVRGAGDGGLVTCSRQDVVPVVAWGT